MRTIQVLSGEWALRRGGDSSWISAQVPGNLCPILFHHGMVKDPWAPGSAAQISWVNRSAWEWVKRFTLDMHDRNLWRLIVKGIQGRPTIHLNGVRVRMRSGMGDVSHLISEENELRVCFPRKRDVKRLNRDGITDDVFLVGSRDVMIDLMFVYCHESGGLWNVHVDLDIYSVRRMSCDCILTIHRRTEARTETLRLDLVRGHNRVQRVVPLPFVEYWYPWDMGDQVIYAVSASVVEDGVELDTSSEFVGFRRVEWSGNRMLVNGVEEFMRGAEWAPLDLFSGEVDERRVLNMLMMALNSNVNTLMLDFREKEVFYTLCDHLGMSVWQARRGRPIRRLLTHPSVVILGERSREFPGTHILADRVFMRNVEFVRGGRSIPGFMARRRFAELLSDLKVNGKSGTNIMRSQMRQARVIQAEVEGVRMRKGRVSGVVIQRFNDAEPCVSESLIDYFGRAKLAYHKLCQTYNLLVAYLRFTRSRQGGWGCSIWVVNDLDVVFEGSSVQVLVSRRGKEDELFSRLMDIQKKSIVHVGDIADLPFEKGAVIRTRISSKGYILAENNYDLASVGR